MSTTQPTNNVPSLYLMISTENTLEHAANTGRRKAALFFDTSPNNIALHLVRAERDADLEAVGHFAEPARYVETSESYHCSFKATVRT